MALFVLKIGGGAALLTPDAQANFCRDVAQLAKRGEKIIVVNGANSLLTKVQTERGIVPRMITSERGEQSRYTDAATIELLKEVYGGVNQRLAELIRANGALAEGYFCSHEKILTAERHGKQRIVEDGKVKVIDGDLTGRITDVNVEFLNAKLESGMVVILTPPAITTDGTEVNVDGDKVASKIATTLKADKLIFLSDTPGLLRDVNDESSVIKEINNVADANAVAQGRMLKKVLSAWRAVGEGVGTVIFGDGRKPYPIETALKTGTKFWMGE